MKSALIGHTSHTLKILGINAFGHDAAAVLLVDGQVAFAASQERFDRLRHSPAFPAEAIHAALEHNGLRASDLDAIAFPWSRAMGRPQKAWHLLRGFPRTLTYLREPPDARLPDRRGYLRRMVRIDRTLARQGLGARLYRIPHHRAHAQSAALLLPEGQGAVLTADGMGEWTTAATWHAEDGRPKRLERAVYPHSVGKAYSAVTSWLGFGAESGEGKTMGLAAYGDEDSARGRFARALLAPSSRGLLRVRLAAFDFPVGAARLYGQAFLDALGAPRPEHGDELRPGDADVAAGIQAAIESFAIRTCTRLLERTRAPALALAGGLFLNCALNGRLARALDVPVHPFPVAGDAGAALGAAATVHHRLTGTPAVMPESLRLGSAISSEGAQAGESMPLPALAVRMAEALQGGAVVGVARGRAEFGPRALGGRSVMASPTSTAKRDDVNARKGRESWRPLAPIVREEDTRYFVLPGPSPHMITTGLATDLAREQIPGVIHEDGTARVQTVAPNGDPFLRALLDALEARGAPPVVINTSLNRRGEPIVDTAEQALTAARAMGLDALVLDERYLTL